MTLHTVTHIELPVIEPQHPHTCSYAVVSEGVVDGWLLSNFITLSHSFTLLEREVIYWFKNGPERNRMDFLESRETGEGEREINFFFFVAEKQRNTLFTV